MRWYWPADRSGHFCSRLSRSSLFLRTRFRSFFSVGSLLVVRRSDEPPPESRRLPPRQLARDTLQGFRWLRNDRRAWVTMILMALTSLVAQALVLMLLAQAHSRDLSTVEIGVVLGASGAGGAVGSICFKFLPDGFKRFWLPIQMVAWSVALASLWLAGGLPAASSAVAMFTLGFTGAIGNIEFGTYLVANVADDMIARVTAIGQVLAIGACAVGPVLGGYAIQRWGVKGAVEILFVTVLLLAFFSLLMPEVSQKIRPAFRSVWRIAAHVQPQMISPRELTIVPRSTEDPVPAVLRGEVLDLSSSRLAQVPPSGHEFSLESRVASSG
jgi:MFS family permease